MKSLKIRRNKNAFSCWTTCIFCKFGALAKATELKNRIIFTLLALVVYRLGTHIPIPGVNPGALDDIFNQNTGGIFGMFDMFAGGF